MTSEKVLSVKRMSTGDQHYVYDVKTTHNEYVIRMTNLVQINKFRSALKWQEILLPLGIPLAKFICSDIECKYSPFPSLLMLRLPGDDLVNVYHVLTDEDKKNIADEIVGIQALCDQLPEGRGYGIVDSYDDIPENKSWFEFIINRLSLYKKHLSDAGVFDADLVAYVMKIAKKLEHNFDTIRARPFLWDASERNVIIYKGRISGIVDVDEICFGDPLFVIALTFICLKLEGHDVNYTNHWEAALQLDDQAKKRLNFYKLFYTIVFMRKHAMQTGNDKKPMFDDGKLIKLYHDLLTRIDGEKSE